MNTDTLCYKAKALRKFALSTLILLLVFAALMAPEPIRATEIEKDDLDILIENIIRQNYPLLIRETLVDHMLDSGRQYLGRPYKFRNPKGEIMDCSNFVKYLYSIEGLTIPRTASQQAAFTTNIPLSEVQKGDLLFFKGSSLASNRVGHVGMVIEVNDGQIKMIHSSNRGIMIDDISMTYYKKRFIQAGRVAELQDSYASMRLIHSY